MVTFLINGNCIPVNAIFHYKNQTVLYFLTGKCRCAVFFAPTEQTSTKIAIILNCMTMDINDTFPDVTGADLYYLQTGDIFYTSILYGTTSALKETERLGEVPFRIGKTIVYAEVLNQSVPVSFSEDSIMSTTVTLTLIITLS